MELTIARLRELAYQAAGAGAAAVMMAAHERHGVQVVMPEEDVSKGVEAVLADFGVPAGGALGYTDDELKGTARDGDEGFLVDPDGPSAIPEETL